MHDTSIISTNYDMRDHFTVGDSALCSRTKSSSHDTELGTVIAVTKFVVIVKFEHSKESYSYYDYVCGSCKVK